MPHAPQFFGSLKGIASQPLASSPSQSTKYGRQRKLQDPETQTGVAPFTAGQAWPQAPQWLTLELVSTQPLPQNMPVPQGLHTPARQYSVDEQACPQAPQWSWWYHNTVSQKFQGGRQSAQPDMQVAPHTPALHAGWPFVTLGQTCPQAPQWLTFVLRSTQELPHEVVPNGQLWHAPLTHRSSAAQGELQLPQWFGSNFKSTQTSPHFVVPPAQLNAHTPAEHTSPEAHAVPQAPQLAGSFLVSVQCPSHISVPVPHTAVHVPFTQISLT